MLRLCVSLLTFKEFMIEDLGVNVLRLGSTSPSCSWFQVFGFGEGRFGIRVLEHLGFLFGARFHGHGVALNTSSDWAKLN